MKNEKEKEWLEGKKITFVNGIINDVVIEIIGHFGNIVTMALLIDTPEGRCALFHGRAFTTSLGFLLKELYETIKEDNDDAVNIIKSLKNSPVRLIMCNNECVGIAHFIQDRFFIEELFVSNNNRKIQKIVW